MASQLKKIFTAGVDQISQNYTVESWHVSQSVDAFTGVAAYDILLSGSFSLTGSLTNGDQSNNASGLQSHAQGQGSSATGRYSHAEGSGSIASGNNSHAKGNTLFHLIGL